ncbi:oxygen-insensitive NADPH nitroreductase [Paenibacillus sp. YYML68]|uniref:oxygen-insensitive NADPH nitroreductase n=1 Tax=Paenibacillus sp. YYML68 TaxID=2909250 RepID=UPI0024904D19|nr:oxygen-insensitive NADPH nitroreductase [Paenibacillus sp. YYML68]
MNETIQLLQQHRSIRKFKHTPLTTEQVEAIVMSAQMASTSSNVQAYTIMAVDDSALKQALSELAGNQAYVAECGLFLVFCADLSRLDKAAQRNGEQLYANTESFIVATVDASLAAQNAAIAAEALGLGICYIGGIRNAMEEVSELLALPPLVYPVFGLCIGEPDQQPERRPRLPMASVLHRNRYDKAAVEDGIDAYDQTMQAYYLERTRGKTMTNWSRGIADKYGKPMRVRVKPYLEAQGFRLDR